MDLDLESEQCGQQGGGPGNHSSQSLIPTCSQGPQESMPGDEGVGEGTEQPAGEVPIVQKDCKENEDSPQAKASSS